jgi:hypothetical protein
MAAKNGTFLNPLVNGPHRGVAPLYAFLFLIGRHTISQFQSVRAHVPFLRFPLDHTRFSPNSPFRKRGFVRRVCGGFRAISSLCGVPCRRIASFRNRSSNSASNFGGYFAFRVIHALYNSHLCMIYGRRPCGPSQSTFQGPSHGIEKKRSHFKHLETQ